MKDTVIISLEKYEEMKEKIKKKTDKLDYWLDKAQEYQDEIKELEQELKEVERLFKCIVYGGYDGEIFISDRLLNKFGNIDAYIQTVANSKENGIDVKLIKISENNEGG